MGSPSSSKLGNIASSFVSYDKIKRLEQQANPYKPDEQPKSYSMRMLSPEINQPPSSGLPPDTLSGRPLLSPMPPQVKHRENNIQRPKNDPQLSPFNPIGYTPYRMTPGMNFPTQHFLYGQGKQFVTMT